MAISMAEAAAAPRVRMIMVRRLWRNFMAASTSNGQIR